MNKKTNKILLWLLSWAVLAVVIVYSPIGSPDLYTTNQYVVYSQGVNFSGGIANAPKSNNYQQYEATEVGLPEYVPSQKTYTVNSSAGSDNLTSQSNYVSTTSTTGRTGGSSSNSGGGGIVTFASGRSSQNNAISQYSGISSVSLTTDLNTGSPVISKPQAAGSAVNGGTDPGGDPEGPPIPVGDGFWILLLMAAAYTFWKIKH